MDMTTLKNSPYYNLAITLLGGLVFVAIFYLRSLTIPHTTYEMRDDGIITLSHAKNLVDYGFIGVSPSGGRVEGYSAPGHFFIYAILYAVTGISFAAYDLLQTWLCTFIMGACFTALFEGAAVYRLGAALLGSVLLAANTTFFQWHSSGMENAITHASLIATLCLMHRSLKTGKLPLWYLLVAFLASISRIESIYYIAPLLCIFSVFWHYSYRSLRGYLIVLLVFAMWAAFTAWRYWYFGSLTPNTAVAQGIDVWWRIQNVEASFNETLSLSHRIFLRQGVYNIAILMPLAYFFPRRLPSARTGFLILCLIMTIAAIYFDPFFFGHARLDEARTTTQLSICIALAACIIVFYAQKIYPVLLALPLLAVIEYVEISYDAMIPYSMCCPIQPFARVYDAFATSAAKENIFRPTMANPDLGYVSWQKTFNIVDLGSIGNPIIATVGPYEMPATNYILFFAAPDFIELHQIWSCKYEHIIFDPRFYTLYEPIAERSNKDGCKGRGRISGLWMRKDIKANSGSAERKLVDSLSANLSTDRIREELATCEADPNNNCNYVVRSAYRFLPEFRNQDKIPELVDIFSKAKNNRQFAYYMIMGWKDGTAYRGAIDDIIHYAK